MLTKTALLLALAVIGFAQPDSPGYKYNAPGSQSAASAPGFNYAAPGLQGAASAPGSQRTAAANGLHGAASANGFQASASAPGSQRAAAHNDFHGAASANGYQGAASANGFQASASAPGFQRAAATNGYRGPASGNGFNGATSASGFQGAAFAPGLQRAAFANSFNGAASANGVPGYSYGAPDLDVAPSTIEEILANPDHPISILAFSIGGGDGVPGQDFPILDSVPETGFLCEDQDYPGYYADEEAGCQVFHICQFDGRQDSFLCPNGTIFNQQYFVCDWWYNADCSATQDFVILNAEIGVVPGANGLEGSASNLALSGAYGAPTNGYNGQNRF